MKKRLTLIAILMLGATFLWGSMGMAQTVFDQIFLQEMSGVDPYLAFGTEGGTVVSKFILDESDANAVMTVLDLPVGGSVYVPVFMVTQSVTDSGYFNGVTNTRIAAEDADGDSWISLGFSADDTPALQVGGASSTVTIPSYAGISWTDNVDIALGTSTDASFEWTTADANANELLLQLPTGGATNVPVFVLSQGDTDLTFFNGVTQTTFAVTDTAATSYVSLDFSGAAAARLNAGGVATSLTLTTPAGGDIVLDAGDAAAGTGQSYVTISGTTAAHAGGTPTDIWLDINPTIGINTAAATQNIVDITFASPAWATAVATNLRGIYIAPTIGNATAGTNAVALIDVAAITGDAQVSLYGIRAGALTGTAATENFLEIGAGWDNGINSASLITGALGLTVTGATVSLNTSSNFGVNLAAGTSTGTITLGGTGTQAIDIGTGVGIKTVTVGSQTTTSATVINSGTGDMIITSMDDLSILGGSAGSILNIGTNTEGNVIHIGDNDTTADAITIGSAKDTTILAGIATTVGSTGTTSATIQSGTGDLALTSTDDITLTTNTTTTDNITITNTPGTAANAIALTATAGGVDIDAAAALDVNIAGGQVMLVSKDNAASAISLTTNIGTTETIVLTNTQGAGEGALTFTATAGGIDFNAATAKNIDFLGGQFIFLSNENVASAFSVTTNTGTNETIVLTNTQGTSESAITLASTAGGVNVDAAAAKDLDLAGGQVKLVSKDDAAGAISLTANIGTSETITVTNTQGTAAGAIALTSSAGGIALTAAASGITASSTKNAGAVVAGTCTAVEYELNGYHRTVLTLLGGTTFALEDKNDASGIKIYDFPQGVIVIHAVFVDATITLDTNVTAPYVMGIGTVIGVDGDAALTTTEANFSPSVAVTNGVAQNWHGLSAAIAGGLIAEPYNGTGGGPGLFVNAGVAAGDIAGAATVAATGGSIVVEWSWLGDF
jgi:hypothetical protein